MEVRRFDIISFFSNADFMKKKTIKQTFLCVTVILCSFYSVAANIKNINGKKVIIEQVEELQEDKIYNVVDRNDKVHGKVKVLKIRGRKAMGRVISGRVNINYSLQVNDDFSDFSSDFENEKNLKTDLKAVRAFLGLALGSDFSSTPFILGADYIHPFFRPLQLKGGLLYWSFSENGADVSLFEISGGAYYPYMLTPKLDLEGGARLGVSMYKNSVSLLGKTLKSDKSNLTLSSYVGAMYKFNNKMRVGAEWRYPFFLSDVDFNGFYLMSVFEYKL